MRWARAIVLGLVLWPGIAQETPGHSLLALDCPVPVCPYSAEVNCCESEFGPTSCGAAPPACWTVDAEYLMWWTRGRNLPPLVTTSPDGTSRDEAGVLGQDDTRILLGDESIGNSLRSGGRITLSRTLDDCGRYYADVRFWGLEDSGPTRFFAPRGGQILARPFFNVTLDREDSQLVAFPGVTTDGRIRVNIHNDLAGAEANGRALWYDECGAQLFWLAGYQFTRLDDSLDIHNVQTSIDPQSALPVGTVLDARDLFCTQNEFHGGQVGFLATASEGCWSVDLAGKFALGNMRERTVIAGRTLVTVPDAGSIDIGGGLLAQPSNSGQRERNRLAFIPQLDLAARYHLGPCCQFTLGYSFLYWSNVVLAADQIDRRINFTQNPGPTIGPELPAFRFRRSDFWAMGLNFGVELQF